MDTILKKNIYFFEPNKGMMHLAPLAITGVKHKWNTSRTKEIRVMILS